GDAPDDDEREQHEDAEEDHALPRRPPEARHPDAAPPTGPTAVRSGRHGRFGGRASDPPGLRRGRGRDRDLPLDPTALVGAVGLVVRRHPRSRVPTTLAGTRVIGVDLGGTKISAGLVAEDGTLERSLDRATPLESQEVLLAAIVEIVRELKEDDVAAV